MASATVTPSREAALKIRRETAAGLRLDVAFGRLAPTLEPRDRAFVHELTYGACRLQGRLDHLLSLRVRGGLGRLDAPVLDVLRLGAYQVLHMDSVPRYAAISQSVEQATAAAGRGAGGLVNAVLRAVADHGEDRSLFPDPEADPVGWLSTWGSHPRWLVERWLRAWPFADVARLTELDNQPPPLTLVPLDLEPDAAVAALAAEGIGARAVGSGTGCVRLAPGADPGRALAVVDGFIQDAAADLVVRYADIPAGTNVADLCAAPGGKALAASRRASFTVAADRSEVRMRRVRDNANRTGRRLGMVVADARHPPFRPMDVVLLDVPCTGTGTLRRHPDGRWRLRPETLTDLTSVQSDFLDSAADLVNRGGLLVYSTCSLEPEENDDQVEAFLRRRPDYAVEATDAVPRAHRDARGFLQVRPWANGFDGSFAARLRRAS